MLPDHPLDAHPQGVEVGARARARAKVRARARVMARARVRLLARVVGAGDAPSHLEANRRLCRLQREQLKGR